MALLLRIEPGGEKFLPLAKAKLAAWKKAMASAGVGSWSKTILGSAGTTIRVSSLVLGPGLYRDAIHIAVAPADGRLLYAPADSNRTTSVDFGKGGIRLSSDGFIARRVVTPTTVIDPAHTEWSKDYSTLIAVSSTLGPLEIDALSQSGGVATCTITGHGFGASASRWARIEAPFGFEHYDGVKELTIVDADTFTFMVTPSAPTPVTGLVGGSAVTLSAQAEIIRGTYHQVVGDVAIFNDETPPSPAGTAYMPVGAMYRRTQVGVTADGKNCFLRSAAGDGLFTHAAWNSTSAAFDITRVQPPAAVQSFTSGFDSINWADPLFGVSAAGALPDVAFFTAHPTYGVRQYTDLMYVHNIESTPAYVPTGSSVTLAVDSQPARLWVNPYRGDEVLAEFKLCRLDSYAPSLVSGNATRYKAAGAYHTGLYRYARDPAGTWGWTAKYEASGPAWWYFSDEYRSYNGYHFYMDSSFVSSTARANETSHVGFEPGGTGFRISWGRSTQPTGSTVVVEGGSYLVPSSGGAPTLGVVETVDYGVSVASIDIKRDQAPWIDGVTAHVGGTYDTSVVYIDHVGTQRRALVVVTIDNFMRWHYDDSGGPASGNLDFSGSVAVTTGSVRIPSRNCDLLLYDSNPSAGYAVTVYKDGSLIWAPPTTYALTALINDGQGTATATSAGHGLVPGDTAVVFDAYPFEYSGSHPVLSAAGDSFTFSIPPGVATPAVTLGRFFKSGVNKVATWTHFAGATPQVLRASYNFNGRFECRRQGGSPIVFRLSQDDAGSWGTRLIQEVPEDFHVLLTPATPNTLDDAALLIEANAYAVGLGYIDLQDMANDGYGGDVQQVVYDLVTNGLIGNGSPATFMDIVGGDDFLLDEFVP